MCLILRILLFELFIYRSKAEDASSVVNAAVLVSSISEASAVCEKFVVSELRSVRG